jgi:glycosyltransferase involved in cell wall biosynthesis
MCLLIFDPHVEGHHLEYIGHLVRHAANGHSSLETHFVVHPQFEDHAPELSRLVEKHQSQLWLHPIEKHEYEAIKTSYTFARVLSTWNVAEKYSRKVEASHCVFLELNLLQPVLGLPRARNVPFKISGTLFFPYCRIEPSSSSLFGQVRTSLERFRKYGQVRWMLSNPRVHSLFVLNDKEAAQELNAMHDTSAFSALPDPVLSSVGSEGAEPPFTTDGASTHFLFFGSMRGHKGVRKLVQATQQLSEEVARRTALHVLGKTRSDLAGELSPLLDDLRRAQPHLQVQHQDRFLEYEELESALDHCDVVLVPYQRTEGSSGVIGHAAKHGKPVIGPRTGLMGALIREYDLGVTVNCTSPSAIAEAMRRCVAESATFSETRGMKQYVEERTPEQFARTLLERVSA